MATAPHLLTPLEKLSGAVTEWVNSVREPWFFHWHKKGPWPWDWKIVQVHNNEIP